MTLTSLVLGFLRDDGGEDLIEYGLLSSFVAAVALATIILDPIGVRTALVGCFGKAVEALYMAAQTDLAR
jgi:Flp pilus assembly pilin Flp